jgi:hypothetical protein
MGNVRLAVATFGLLFRSQFVPRASEGELYSECSGEKQVDLACFHLLKISRCDFCFFGQFVLCHIPANTLAPDICTKCLDSGPLFSGQSHDILHRLLQIIMNDAYIVKKFRKFERFEDLRRIN